MADTSRDDLLLAIEQGMRLIEETTTLITTVIERLADTTLSEEDTLKLQNEKEELEEELSELRKDVAVYEESLDILDMNTTEEPRYYSAYEERYDPNDEVFTGGDY